MHHSDDTKPLTCPHTHVTVTFGASNVVSAHIWMVTSTLVVATSAPVLPPKKNAVLICECKGLASIPRSARNDENGYSVPQPNLTLHSCRSRRYPSTSTPARYNEPIGVYSHTFSCRSILGQTIVFSENFSWISFSRSLHVMRHLIRLATLYVIFTIDRPIFSRPPALSFDCLKGVIQSWRSYVAGCVEKTMLNCLEIEDFKV